MRPVHDPPEFRPLGVRHRAVAVPAESLAPAVADEGHERRRPVVAVELLEPTVDAGESFGVGGHRLDRPVAADDHPEGRRSRGSAREKRPQGPQLRGEHSVGFGPLGLDVDEQCEGFAAGLHAAGRFESRPDGLEIECGERLARAEFPGGVADEQVAVAEEHIGLHAREPAFERVEKRPVVPVVVVGVAGVGSDLPGSGGGRVAPR